MGMDFKELQERATKIFRQPQVDYSNNSFSKCFNYILEANKKMFHIKIDKTPAVTKKAIQMALDDNEQMVAETLLIALKIGETNEKQS